MWNRTPGHKGDRVRRETTDKADRGRRKEFHCEVVNLRQNGEEPPGTNNTTTTTKPTLSTTHLQPAADQVHEVRRLVPGPLRSLLCLGSSNPRDVSSVLGL